MSPYRGFPSLVALDRPRASASTLPPEDGVLFSKCLEKGGPVDYLLDVIAAFPDSNEVPDFGR